MKKHAGKEISYQRSKETEIQWRPNYYIMQLRRSSRSFTNLVMDVYKSGKVNGEQASRLLSVREEIFRNTKSTSINNSRFYLLNQVNSPDSNLFSLRILS